MKHAFDWILRCGYVACSRCALLRLNNEKQAIKRPCEGRED